MGRRKDNIDEFLDDLSGTEGEEGGETFHPIIIVNRDEIPDVHADSVRDNAVDDYKFVRRNIKQIIETNVKAMERISKIAGESDSVRAFEVMSAYMKQMLEANESLMRLHKEAKEITESPDSGGGEGEGTGEPGATHNTYIFNGSTEDLLNMIENREKIERGEIIEGDTEE